MSLHVPPAPSGAERVVRAALLSPPTPTPHPLYLARGALRLALPLPVHRLTPLADVGTPPQTELTGWRFLVERDGRTVGAAETKLTVDGWAFSHLLEGPYTASTAAAVRQAETLPTAYQPRLLSVPELYMLTLWLHADAEADPAHGLPAPPDLLVPLSPAPPGIAPDLPVPVTALLTMITRRGARAPVELAG